MTVGAIIRYILASVALIALLNSTGFAAQHKEGTVPDFTLQSPSGDKISLAAYVGKKPVLLVFWASWCPLCRSAVPRLNRIYSASKVQVLAVNVEESRRKATSFISEYGVTYPVVLDPDGKATATFQMPGVPGYVIIDTAGRIVYRGESFPDAMVSALSK